MSLMLERINAVPLQDTDFSAPFEQWLSILVDSLNETLNLIETNVVYRQSITGTTQSASINTDYIVVNDALTTISLPRYAQRGAIIRVTGLGANGWKIIPFSGQTIQVLTASASTSLSSSGRYDCISLTCVIANTLWVTTYSETSGFVLV